MSTRLFVRRHSRMLGQPGGTSPDWPSTSCGRVGVTFARLERLSHDHRGFLVAERSIQIARHLVPAEHVERDSIESAATCFILGKQHRRLSVAETPTPFLNMDLEDPQRASVNVVLAFGNPEFAD